MPLMRLQRQLSRKVGKKEYDKWVLVIPPDKVREVGFNEGEELSVSVKDKKIIIWRED